MVKTVRNLTVLGIGLSISALVGWLLLRERKRDQSGSTTIVKSQSAEPATSAPIVLPREALEEEPAVQRSTRRKKEPSPRETRAAAQDDLTQIRDIGPRFADALRSVGITSYAQLAAQTPEELAARLAGHVNVRPERIRQNDWIGQAARLAKS